MSRLIDADEIKYQILKPNTNPSLWVASKEAIDLIPTVDAVPVVHGHWVFSEKDDMFYCTNCKNGSVRNDYPYCHWCGAVMDGEKVTE